MASLKEMQDKLKALDRETELERVAKRVDLARSPLKLLAKALEGKK